MPTRTLRLLALLLALTLTASAAPARGQDAADSFADLGLPEISVTIDDTAITGVPAELAAGRYVLRVTNGAAEGDLGIGFLQPPDGMTAADFIAFVTSAPPEAAVADASPVVAGEGDGDAGPPAFYYEINLAGGVYAGPGTTRSAVLDLTPGTWVVWTEEPGAPQAPVAVVVAGEAPTDLPKPVADVTITAVEMAFQFDGELKVGRQTIAFTNAGEQPHVLLLLTVPAGTTVDDFLALSATFDDPAATPPDNLSFQDITNAVQGSDQSSGVTTWLEADLEAGDYIAVCFVPDPETGAPHAMLGMIDLVTVA